MLWSFVAPLSIAAEYCAGTPAVLMALSGRASGDHHAGGHSDVDGEAADHHHEGDHHHDAGVPDDHHAVDLSVVQENPAPSLENRFSYCCTDPPPGDVRDVLDVPTLTVATTLWKVILPVAVYQLFISPLVDLASPPASAYKIGSSPPFHATADQHTYLRYSLLLI